MSFFMKGDYKIQQTWESTKGKDNNRARSRNEQKRSSGNVNGQSLMRQLADSLAQPTTDIIDDSLSQFLQKQKEGMYGALPPKVKKQSVQQKKTADTSLNSKKIQGPDSQLISSMANRLQKLEKTCQSQRLEIKQQKEVIQKIKTENAFLKGMKQDSGKAYQDMQALKAKNTELEKKVAQMEAYLKQHGLKWVGQKLQGKLDQKSIKKQIADSKSLYRLPSQIDITTIRRRVADLNAGLQQEGRGTQIYSDNGVHKFRASQTLPIGFYSNGIVVKGYNFYPYKSKQSLKILADILDGYFPYIFKGKYPDGVLLEVVDHIEQQYVQEKKEQRINGLDDKNDFQPMSKQEFVKKFPKEIIKNGKIIPIRQGIQKMFNPATNSTHLNNNQGSKVGEDLIIQADGILQLKTKCWEKIEKKQVQVQDCCNLKIRLDNGKVYVVKMLKEEKIADILGELRKISKQKICLLANYPKRVFNGNQSETLQDLGFYPNQNLQVQVTK